MISAGWWFECGHCGCRFSDDGREDCEDDEREDEYEPVTMGKQNYCSPTCAMEEWAERQKAQNLKHAAIEACSIKWPGALKINANIAYAETTNTLVMDTYFTFPGSKYSVHWTVGDKMVEMFPEDVELFTAWKLTQ